MISHVLMNITLLWVVSYVFAWACTTFISDKSNLAESRANHLADNCNGNLHPLARCSPATSKKNK
jgi:hypothetical protein